MQEIIINVDKENTKTIALVKHGVLLEKYVEEENKKRLEGNIYIGIIKDILPGMQSAFIDIGEEKNAFIHINDILPKIDTKSDEEKTNVDNYDIRDLVKPGMPILVQVTKDAYGNKGPKVTKHISLTSRFLVFMPNTNFITISQKIEDEEEKNRLINIIKENKRNDVGIIIRTSSYGKTKENLKEDMDNLYSKWKEINSHFSEEIKSPILVKKYNNIIERLIIDLIDKKIDRIITNNIKISEDIKEILQNLNCSGQISLETRNEENILDIYDLNSQIEKLKNRKVWLKCGGFITIDKTEALTAIDVNSGKYTGKKNLEETLLIVNKEASVEIAKQLRLRDIGGIVIIDYIDMQKEESKQEVLKILKENLKNDRSKIQVLEFTKLNLLELTRKHICGNN